MTSLRPDSLAWTALLGKWVDFARASLALPRDAAGERWRRSLVPLINLQAITFALADLDILTPADRAVAADKAAILVTGAVAELEGIWEPVLSPDLLRDIIQDARIALDRVRNQKEAEQS